MDAPPLPSNDADVSGSSAARAVVAVAATFTAEPIADTLSFWATQLDVWADVGFAPYNQVFQTLLDPSSVFRRNRGGANVVLVRFSDWGDQAPESVDELVSSLGQANAAGVPHLVVCCPGRRASGVDSVEQDSRLTRRLAEGLQGKGDIYLLTAEDVDVHYPVRDRYDSHGDAVGHVPYTPLYFAALGTAIMRKLAAVWRAPYKAVALDCDGTLWKGIVGEDGVDGIEIEADHAALQRFMVRQHDAGALLCLASKNNDADVEEVFARRTMPLAAEHIVASKVNWAPKPDNLRELAAELNIGLDSFVFVDDSAVECSQMQIRAPEVLTLQLPGSGRQLTRFLEHVWAFDRVRVTGTDKKRTAMYRENVARERSRSETASLESFLQGLRLEIEISELSPDHVPRAAQLTQRTNQFSLTTIRRSEGEVAEFGAEQGHVARVVHVRDRFGDYGLVGLMLARPQEGKLEVDTLLLSCRALGRGVEHAMLAVLGSAAQELGLEQVVLLCRSTAKNAPARAFFRSLKGSVSDQAGARARLELPSAEVAKLAYEPGSDADVSEGSGGRVEVGGVDRGREAEITAKIATALATPEQILAAVQAGSRLRRDDALGPFVPPSTDTEETTADVWRETLLIDRVGVHDSFLAIGGNSLLATRIISRLRDAFEVDLSLQDFFDHPTVSGLAVAIEDAILRELEAL